MRQVRLRIADTEGDRQPPLPPQGNQRLQCRVEPEPLVERDDPPGRHGEGRTQPLVRRIPIGDDGVEAVVAAVELDQHQHPVGPAGGADRADSRQARQGKH